MKPGDLVEVTVPPLESETLPRTSSDVVYEDSYVLVINKAQRWCTPPPAIAYAGHAVLARCPDLAGIGGEVRPGIVHRLDKDTTGLIVVAKNENALRSLQDQMKAREVRRLYVALCLGKVRQDAGTVDAPIGRHPVHRKKMAVVPTGRHAITDYEVLARFAAQYTLVLAMLRTGRTHQIRVHMAHLGHPVAGDPVYSRGKDDLGLEGQALHALALGFRHPATGHPLEFCAPLPEDLKKALETLARKYPDSLKELQNTFSRRQECRDILGPALKDIIRSTEHERQQVMKTAHPDLRNQEPRLHRREAPHFFREGEGGCRGHAGRPRRRDGKG